LQIEDRIRWISLRKEGLLGRQLNDSAPQTGARQKGGYIKRRFIEHNHPASLLSVSISARGL
jgi:hypothetical protein